MAKTLEQMMANFTIEEQEEIQAEADKLIAEEITLQKNLKFHFNETKIL